MKKTILTNVSILLLISLTAVGCAASNATEQNATSASIKSLSELPELHKVEIYTFQAPYSCKGDYSKSALFLSNYSKQRNSPDLLFNGACGSQLYIQASTAGDDFSLISDLGVVPLESVSASKSLNYDRTVGSENNFKGSMPVTEGHTYSVLISKSEIRALYVLKVEKILPNGMMIIRYAVKSYSIQKTVSESPDFNWEKGNQ